MKRLISLFVFMFSSIFLVNAQLTSVTATITDSDSIAWTGAKWRVTFVPNSAFPNINNYSINGVVITSNTYAQYIDQSGVTNGSGVLSVTLLNNTAILPAGSSWRFTIQSNTSAPATSYTPVGVNGSSESLSTFLSNGAVAPRFPALGTAFGYADTEVSPTPTPGGFYYNVSSTVQRIWTGSSWTNNGGGGGGIGYPAGTGLAVVNAGAAWGTTLATSTFAQTANNLNDLANAATSRTNLGLGTAAVVTAPQNTPAVSNEALTAYNSTTGAYTQGTFGNVSASALTTNCVLKATGSSTITCSLLADDGTTLTYTGIGGVKIGSGSVIQWIGGSGTPPSGCGTTIANGSIYINTAGASGSYFYYCNFGTSTWTDVF